MKTLVLPWRQHRLLVAQFRADDGRLRGVRPLEDSVAFGERADAARVCEFLKEPGVTVRILGAPFVIAKLDSHEDCSGHEVLFPYTIALSPGPYETQARFVVHEDSGAAAWPGGTIRKSRNAAASLRCSARSQGAASFCAAIGERVSRSVRAAVP